MSPIWEHDSNYRKSNIVSFTHGSIRVTLDQSTPLLPEEWERFSVQADKVLGRLTFTASQVGSRVSDFVMSKRIGQGSCFTEGAAWQDVDKFHIRARVVVSLNRAAPEFIASEAVDLVLAGFRPIIRDEFDASYKAYKAEERARQVAENLKYMMFGDSAEALAFLDAMSGGWFAR